jgi:hypothetical protein
MVLDFQEFNRPGEKNTWHNQSQFNAGKLSTLCSPIYSLSLACLSTQNMLDFPFSLLSPEIGVSFVNFHFQTKFLQLQFHKPLTARIWIDECTILARLCLACPARSARPLLRLAAAKRQQACRDKNVQCTQIR